MKFANIDFEGYYGVDQSEERTNVNIGDFIEILAIDYLYQYMGIQKQDIITINFYDLRSYSGEPVILPLNFRLMIDFPQWDIVHWSPNITPVFIGVSLVSANFSAEMEKTLRRYEPIGCRDEATYKLLIQKGIKAYLGACITLTLPTRKETPQKGKIFLIDVPEKAKEYIPERFYDKIEILNHEFYDDVHKSWGISCKEYTKNRLAKYENEAEMIITSRYHATISGLALGIPTVTILENYHDKFGVFENLIPIYDKTSLERINWNPGKIDYDSIKLLMLETAKNHIFWKYLEGMGRDNNEVRECVLPQMNQLTQIYINKSNRKRVEQALIFSDEAIEFIEKNWKRDREEKVAIWGLSQTGLNIIDFLNTHYPNIELVEIYDTYKAGKEVTINDKKFVIKLPQAENIKNDYFIFVASNSASIIAEKLFANIEKDKFYLCRLRFIKEISKQE